MSRSDMSDLEWEFIKCVLPNKTRGVKRVDDRRVIDGIFYVLRVVARGAIFRISTVPTQRCTTALTAGRKRAFGIG